MALPEEQKRDGASKEHVIAAKNGILYIVGQLIASFSVLVLLVLIARLLRPSEFGLYAIVIAFYTLLGIAGNFGIGTAIRKKIPEIKTREERSRLIANAYALAIGIAIIIAIAGVLLSNSIAISIYHQPGITTALQLASILVIFWVFFNLTISVLVGLERVKEATIIDLVYSILQPIAAVSLVLLGYGVFGAIAGIAISIVLGSILGLYYLSKHVERLIIRPTKKLLRELFDFSVPIATSNIAVLGPSNFAILLLGVYASSAVVGNYNAGYELGNFVSIIFTSATFVLLPYFASAFSKRKSAERIGDTYNSTIYYTLLFLLPVLAFVISISQPLMFLFFSNAYAMTPFFFEVIALGTALGIFGAYAGTLIVAYGDTRRFMLYQLAFVLIEIILLFALTPLLKGLGVLLSIFIIGPIFLDMIYLLALQRQFKFRPEFGRIIRLIAASLITFIILYSATSLIHQSKYSIIINLVLAIIIYTPAAALLGGFTGKEIEFLREICDSYKIEFIAKYILDYAQFFIRK